MTIRQFMILILFITSLPFQLKAMDNSMDSLRHLMHSNHRDQEVVDAMNAMAKEFMIAGISDSAKYYADNAYEISTDIKYSDGIAISSILIFNYQWSYGQVNEAKASIAQLINVTKQLHSNEKLGKAYYNIALVFGLTGETDSAIYYFKESLALKLKDSLTVMADFVGLGNIFGDIGEFDSSIYYKIQAARIAELSGKDEHLATIYGNIGVTFSNLGEFDEAEKYIKMGLEIAKQNKDVKLTANNLIYLGGLYFQKGDIANALESLNEAKELLESAGITNRSDLYTGYALIYEAQGKYKRAIEFYDKALNISKDENDPSGKINCLMNVGNLYTKLGMRDLARQHLDSALEIAAETGYRREQLSLMLLCSKNSFEAGNQRQAYFEYEAYNSIKDSMFNLEKTQIVAELKQKYVKGKDQARILSLEKETLKKTLQRNLILFNSSALLVAALFFLMILRHKLIKSKIISKLRIHQLEEEKKIMVARNIVEGQEEERKRIALELHDGLGVLLSATKMYFTSIRNDIPKDRTAINKAISLLDKATGEVRRISHNMMPGLLTKLGLYEAVEDIIDDINEMKDIKAYINIEGDKTRLPENKEIMIYRIIQEMVNNTLKYAKAKRVDLNINRSALTMTINYKDDGIGFDVDEKLKSNNCSLGLKSIQSRVVFLNGEIIINSFPGKGVNFFINIPLELDK